MNRADNSDLADDHADRVFVVGGRDEAGDWHTVFTDSAERAADHYRRMQQSLTQVRGNTAFELLRPLIDRTDSADDPDER